jgi:hypothetical protein
MTPGALHARHDHLLEAGSLFGFAVEIHVEGGDRGVCRLCHRDSIAFHTVTP